MDILNRRPELKDTFETLCRTRRDEILAQMVKTDGAYDQISRARADASMALKRAVGGTDADGLFEGYTDAVYAQEAYELDAVYKQALRDALEVLEERGLL